MKFNKACEILKNRKQEIETVVEFLIQTGMLELNELDGIAIHYEDNRVKEVHIDDFIYTLFIEEREYSKMCKEVLFAIAKSNLRRVDNEME